MNQLSASDPVAKARAIQARVARREAERRRGLKDRTASREPEETDLLACGRCGYRFPDELLLAPAYWPPFARYCVPCADEYEDLFEREGYPPFPKTATAPAGGGGSQPMNLTTPRGPSSGPTIAVPAAPVADDSGRRLRRHRKRYRDRDTEWVTAGPDLGATVAELHTKTERVYLSGGGWATVAELLEWVAVELPAGWGHGPHYLDLQRPVMHVTRPDGRQVELHTSRAWFGVDLDPEVARRVWGELAGAIADRFDEGRMLSTPATTGRYLVVRSLPFSAEVAVLDPEIQELLRSTSGQGRAEMIGGHGPTIGELHQYDARFAYAALCWGLPANVPVRDTVPEFAGHQRGRYLASWRVPSGWPHRFGLLGYRDDGADGWRYPWEPGDGGRGWVDGAELQLAIEHGWPVTIHERLLFPDGGTDPLRGWAGKLVAIREASECPHVRAGVRAILLHALGAMHGRGRTVTRLAPPGEVPAGARGVQMAGPLALWREDTGQQWTDLAHPEWTAAIYARQRRRLLDAPTGTAGMKAGALHAPPGSVLAFRTDAIYLTQSPGLAWPDDGKVGRYRIERTIPGPIPTPITTAELLDARGA